MATRRTMEYLDGHGVKYVVLSHSPAYTAQEVAASAHIPGKELAKVVVVDLDGRMALAVVPASREVDFDGLRTLSGAVVAELADESEFRGRFEGCRLGAMPPFGNLFGMETYVDEDLAGKEYLAFNAGTHTELIAMSFADYQRVAKPWIGPISATPALLGSRVVQR